MTSEPKRFLSLPKLSLRWPVRSLFLAKRKGNISHFSITVSSSKHTTSCYISAFPSLLLESDNCFALAECYSSPGASGNLGSLTCSAWHVRKSVGLPSMNIELYIVLCIERHASDEPRTENVVNGSSPHVQMRSFSAWTKPKPTKLSLA